MKKREKKLYLAKETVRDLETSKLQNVLGGVEGDELEPCITTGSSHRTQVCP